MSEILAIDIGSSKICALIAKLENGSLTIVGSGVARSQGLKKGAIVNIENVAKAIKSAHTDACSQAGIEIARAIVSINGAYVNSVDSHGLASIPTKEIMLKDINRAMENAIYHASILPDYEIVHALPFDFKVDDQTGVQDPVGMSASRLEMSVHIIIAQKSALENLRKALDAAGITIANIVLCGYASALAILSDDEKERGACVIDIGGATSNLLIYSSGAPRYNDVFAVGGSNITADLAYGVHTTLTAAERIKIEHGSLTAQSNGTIEVPATDNEGATRPASLDVMSKVIAARIEETLLVLAGQLDKSQMKKSMGAGIVLTGGASKHEGLAELASPIFNNASVRIARAKTINGSGEALRDPVYAAALGLLRYAAGEATLYERDSACNLRVKTPSVVANATKGGNFAENEPLQEKEKPNLTDITSIPNPEPVSPFGKLRQFWEWLSKIF
ncbi:cell division protein FtsA [Campylobacterota bacterium]|nr:cell division protein FtsA [Campylobacterota bacterium]